MSADVSIKPEKAVFYALNRIGLHHFGYGNERAAAMLVRELRELGFAVTPSESAKENSQ